MLKRKSFKNLIYFFAILMTLFFSMSLIINNQANQISDEQVIYKVDDLDEAITLANKYHLSFDKLSSRGIATFYLTNKTDMALLTSLGFAYNGTSHIVAPPWQEPTDEDPLLSDQYALELMDTIQSWQLTEGSSDVTVAIIDTGINITHDEFVGRISPLSYNATTDTVGLEAVIDDHGHGTMVAGVIGAERNNSVGIAGITSNVQLMVIKANSDGEDTFSDSAIIDGIYYAVDNGADIINFSLGGEYDNPLKEEALQYALNQGVILVASSGNDGTDQLTYPASYDSTISVSAVNEEASIADYSNFGETIDIAAPGTRIVTTNNYNGYATTSGTSFAAPQVAGVLALMLSYFPDMESEEIIQRLFLSSVDKGDPGIDNSYGYGLVNTYNALTFDIVKVSFNTYGGSNVEPLYLLNNNLITPPTPPIYEDYSFVGWFKDTDLTIPWDFENDIVTEDTTLHAKYNKEFHEVTLISNGIITDTFTVNDGDTFALPILTLEGYNFIGWTLDQENLIPYELSPVYNNLTLYAHFEEIIYHNVHKYVNGELLETIQVENGQSYQPSPYEEDGHTFDGWYLDEDYTTPYDGSTPIENDINIYGQSTTNIYTITLMINQTIYDQIEVSYNQVATLPEPSIEGSHFIDWYYSDALINPYEDTPITSDLTLYARNEDEAFQVTYLVDDSAQVIWHSISETFEPYTPTKDGYEFLGWFYDQTYTNAYEPIILDQNITLYAKFEEELYTVTFYEIDQETIIFETEVTYGQSVTPPSAPDISPSISFTYTFTSWSDNTDNITSDLNVYPQYNQEFIEGSVHLEPGIDTLETGQMWVDASVTELDPFLTLIVSHQIDTSETGKYLVEYFIYDDTNLVTTLYRYIRVIEAQQNIKIILNEGISTVEVGSDYVEPGATSTVGEVTIISNVDTSQVGIYTVEYLVEVDEITYKKTRFVHVVDQNSMQSTIYWYKEESDQYEA